MAEHPFLDSHVLRLRSATDSTKMIDALGDPVTGGLIAAFGSYTTAETQNVTVNTTTALTVTPAAASKYVLIMDETGNQLRYKINGMAATNDGIAIPRLGGSGNDVELTINTISIFNEGATQSKASVQFIR